MKLAECSTKTTCPYCGVGCGVIATPQADGSVKIEGDKEHPANFGRLCSKGAALGETTDLEGRLLHPQIFGKTTEWDTALDTVAKNFSDTIKEHGPDSVAFYVSGQILTEDYYVANKLMKGFIGSANIDTNSRLCMASSVAGHKRAFGADTVPGNYEDLELADLIILVGSNLAWCHPVLYQRIAAAKQARPQMKVVLIDPRRTMTAELADIHLPIKLDGDVALFNGLLKYLSTGAHVNHAYVEAHTVGLEQAVSAALISDEALVEQTGIDLETLHAFYELFAQTQKTVTCYSQGVNQSVSGTDKVNAIINCHLITGRIGSAGMGPFSLTGQPNAMGGREVGGLANMLACHMDIDDENHRDLVQEYWKSPVIAQQAGLKAVDLFKAVESGQIKALWIMATNPVDSMPDSGRVEEAIKNCPFVVVSDVMQDTDTIRHAHVKLPSAAWGEKDGTVTNSERRISRQRGFLELPGDTKSDWWQLAEVGKRMGFAKAFTYEKPADIFAEYAALSSLQNNGTRDFDIGGLADLDAAAYDQLAPTQWPITKDGSTKARFFSEGDFYTPERKARFVPTIAKVTNANDEDELLSLNTGRVRDHWHTMTRTAKAARLSAHIAEPFCEIHPKDAKRLGIEPATLVELSNAFGTITMRALVTKRQKQGTVFCPIHWADQYASNARVDRLVHSVTDPISGQPASKNVLVQVKPKNPRYYGFAVMSEMPSAFDVSYWAKAKCEGGWRCEFAFEHEEDLKTQIESATGLLLSDASVEYEDKASGSLRYGWFDDDRLICLFFVSNNPVEVSRVWAIEQLLAKHENSLSRNFLVAGRAGADVPDRGPIVCSCFSVGANEIADAARSGYCSVDDIGKQLKAGTNCGSCKSEIAGIINMQMAIAAE
ncbi:MAG: molybdopterin-dependent oxidoreductase [Nitratireductor sp.]